MQDEPVEGMLDAREARVLGSLMEKQMTTPDYYPLTLKALTAACNQKSSRNPVMHMSEGQVGAVVQELRRKGLVTAMHGGRADRFEQHLSRKLKLNPKERAALTVLMLRGPQTLAEIRANTARMAAFASADDARDTLDALIARGIALLLPRRLGQREERFMHLLCGRDTPDAGSHADAAPEPARTGADAPDLAARVARLEAEVERLNAIVRRLAGEA